MLLKSEKKKNQAHTLPHNSKTKFSREKQKLRWPKCLYGCFIDVVHIVHTISEDEYGPPTK